MFTLRDLVHYLFHERHCPAPINHVRKMRILAQVGDGVDVLRCTCSHLKCERFDAEAAIGRRPL